MRGLIKCDALCDLVPFVQFKKRKKHPWRSVNFSKAAGLKPATNVQMVTNRATHHKCILSRPWLV